MTDTKQTPTYEHFKDKDALGHVVEAQARGIIASSEIHGTEIPGPISAGTDAARETIITLLLVWAVLYFLGTTSSNILLALGVYSVGWLTWKAGRAAWLGWARLERLHRIVAEERWEIEHNRQQERDELRELYRAKGFQGKLLEDVLDVLMADGDRLLRVMVEEELGLSLGVHEHPLKQALGAALGVLVSSSLALLGLWLGDFYGILVIAPVIIGISAGISAKFERNQPIPATVWNLGLAVLAFGVAYFLMDFLTPRG